MNNKHGAPFLSNTKYSIATIGDPQFQAQYGYEAQQKDELSLQPGDKVRVLSNDNADWWTVENVETGSKGMVPSNVRSWLSAYAVEYRFTKRVL